MFLTRLFLGLFTSMVGTCDVAILIRCNQWNVYPCGIWDRSKKEWEENRTIFFGNTGKNL